MGRLIKLWRGELPLFNAFWDFAVIGAVIVNGLTSVLFFVLLMNDRPWTAFVAGYAISVPYNLVAAVGVWRSAGRYQGDPKWATAARIVSAVGLAILSAT